MQARLEAVWKKDAATWSRLTADEFTVVVPEGKLMTKADRLAALNCYKQFVRLLTGKRKCTFTKSGRAVIVAALKRRRT
jgi:hypothetical protein